MRQPAPPPAALKSPAPARNLSPQQLGLRCSYGRVHLFHGHARSLRPPYNLSAVRRNIRLHCAAYETFYSIHSAALAFVRAVKRDMPYSAMGVVVVPRAMSSAMTSPTPGPTWKPAPQKPKA